MRRLLVILVLALAAYPALAASKLDLILPASGPFTVWFDTAYPGAPTSDALPVSETSTTLTLPAKGYLAVLDKKTGNLAVKPLAGLKDKLALTASDFTDVGEVDVAVEYNGQPVFLVNGEVDVKDGRRLQKATGGGDDGSSGVHLFGIKPGSLDVVVHYEGTTKPTAPVHMVFDVKLDRLDVVPTFKVAVPEATMTIENGPPEKGTLDASKGDAKTETPPPAKPAPPSTGQMFAKLLQMIIGLIAAGLLIYFVFWLWKSHSGALQEKLEGLGVQIPKDPNDAMADAPIIAATPIQPKPVEKIMLADSDPTPLGTPLPAPISQAPAVPGQAPHLVSDTGASMNFGDGVTELGRDQAAAFGIADPSTLSRRHAEFVRAAESLSVRDLGSTNGTYVNGRKIDAETPLRPGDTVQLGAVRFRVEA